MIETIIIAILFVLYIFIGAFLDRLFLEGDDIFVIMFWPFVFPFMWIVDLGNIVAVWFEEKNWQKMFGGKKDDKN